MNLVKGIAGYIGKLLASKAGLFSLALGGLLIGLYTDAWTTLVVIAKLTVALYWVISLVMMLGDALKEDEPSQAFVNFTILCALLTAALCLTSESGQDEFRAWMCFTGIALNLALMFFIFSWMEVCYNRAGRFMKRIWEIVPFASILATHGLIFWGGFLLFLEQVVSIGRPG